MRRAPFLRSGLILATLGSYAVVGWRPELLAVWGIRLPLGQWFVDTDVLLAASDAHARGLDVPLWYSHWWFWMHAIGLSRADTPWLGLALVAVFLCGAFFVLRPRSFRELTFCWLTLCSPVVLLGVNRANVDLLIFAALALTGWLLSHRMRWCRLAAPLVISLLAGLKFYPIVAAAALPFAPQSRRENWLSLGFMTVLAALLGVGLYDDVVRVHGLISTPVRLYTFGATQIIPHDAAGRPAALVAAALGLALVLFWWRRAPEPPAGLESRDIVLFVLGAVTLAGCFFAGVSYSYRLVLGLLMLPLLGALRRAEPSRRLQHLSGATLAGLLVLFWLDGVVCLFLNLRWGPWPLAAIIDVRQLVYGLASWLWMGAVIGLLVMLARPVCRKMLQSEA